MHRTVIAVSAALLTLCGLAGQASAGKAVAATAKQAAAAPATEADQPIPASQQFGYVLSPSKLEARAIGSYAKGCLAGARMLPINGPAWQAMRLSRNRNWGHPALTAFLERFAAEVKEKDGWPGLLIGDMSQPRGGPMLTGHRSHQIGLDADIWYMPMPPAELTREERETLVPLQLTGERDTSVIAANWQPAYVTLLKRAASAPEVERILVHPAVKKALCEGAGNDRAWLSKVRPIYGHNYHFHVRLACPKGAAGCIPQPVPPGGDGCGKQLDDWLKLVSRPPKPAPPPKPGVIVKRRKPVTIADLPKECRAVLAEGTERLLDDAAPVLVDVPLPERRSVQLAQP